VGTLDEYGQFYFQEVIFNQPIRCGCVCDACRAYEGECVLKTHVYEHVNEIHSRMSLRFHEDGYGVHRHVYDYAHAVLTRVNACGHGYLSVVEMSLTS
jgi:hypothetical protein